VVRLPKVVKVEVPILKAADQKKLDRLQTGAEKMQAAMRIIGDATKELLERITKATAVVPTLPVDPAFVRAFNGPTLTNAQKASAHFAAKDRSDGIKRVVDGKHIVKVPVSDPRPTFTDKPGDGAPKLGKCERSLMSALVQHGRLSLQQAAIIACYAVSGGTRNAAAALRTAGFVTGGNDMMEATGAGRAWLGPVDELPVGSALAEFWYRKLGKCERELLRHIVGAHPAAVSLEEAAKATNYEVSGGTRNAAAKLRTLTLVHGGNAAMVADERLVD
jgi:hypothetical protein